MHEDEDEDTRWNEWSLVAYSGVRLDSILHAESIKPEIHSHSHSQTGTVPTPIGNSLRHYPHGE